MRATKLAQWRSVLIWSKDADTRQVIKDLLEHEGYETTLASGTNDVDARSRCAAAVVDLALYDASEVSVVHTLWAAFPGMPMIIFTGHDSDHRVLQSISHLPWQTIRKPYDSNELKQKLQQVLAHSSIGYARDVAAGNHRTYGGGAPGG